MNLPKLYIEHTNIIHSSYSQQIFNVRLYMKYGGWTPLAKALKKELPKDRAFSRVEAAFSLQCDFDDEKEITVAGYAALWQWSRNKVYKFLKDMDIEIKYDESIKKKQNQKGQIAIQIRDRSGTDNGQIRLINSKQLEQVRDRSKTDKGQIKDRSEVTTVYPDPKPDIKKKKQKRFIPPTIEEVKIYCSERKNDIDPESFIDHYEASGWMRGKNKIKCWKACMRTWEKNNGGNYANGNSKTNQNGTTYKKSFSETRESGLF